MVKEHARSVSNPPHTTGSVTSQPPEKREDRPVPSATTSQEATAPGGQPQHRGDASSRFHTYLDECNAYLIEHGWVRLGVNERGVGLWGDPYGAERPRSERRPAVQLPIAGGGFETVYQWFGGPAAWTYMTEEAVSIQRQRDLTVEDLGDVIRRKEAELHALYERSGMRGTNR